MIQIQKTQNNGSSNPNFGGRKQKRPIKKFQKIAKLMTQEEENSEKETIYFEAYDHYRNAASLPREIKTVPYEELERELLADQKVQKQYTDQKTGVSWYVRNDETPYLTTEQAYQFYQVCGESEVEPLQKFNEITGMIRMLDQNTILYMRENELCIENEKKEQICRKLKHFSYDTLMTVLERFPKTEEYMNEAYWEALTATYHQRLERQAANAVS